MRRSDKRTPEFNHNLLDFERLALVSQKHPDEEGNQLTENVCHIHVNLLHNLGPSEHK